MKIRSLMVLCGVSFVFFACSPPPANDSSNKAIKLEAKQAIMKVGGALKKNLIANIKKGGMVGAAKYCSLSSVSRAKEVSKTLPKGVSVKRITLKPRNINNKANEKDSKVLKSLANQKENGKMPKMVVKKINDNHYKVYKPILMGGLCLQCHGTDNTRNKEAYNEILKHFPNDKAIGYKMKDLRGAFVVDIVK